MIARFQLKASGASIALPDEATLQIGPGGLASYASATAHWTADLAEVWGVPSYSSDFFVVWSAEGSGALLLLRHYREAGLVLLRASGSAMPIPLEPRMPDEGLRTDRIVETRRGPLVVWEHGVIALCPDGSTRWRRDIPTIDTLFEHVRDDLVVFSNEFSGGERFRLDDGARVPGP